MLLQDAEWEDEDGGMEGAARGIAGFAGHSAAGGDYSGASHSLYGTNAKTG